MTKWEDIILSLFKGDTGAEHTAQALGMRWGKNSGVFFATLQSLEERGWLMSRREGRYRYYKLAPLGLTEGLKALEAHERMRGVK